MGLSRNMIFGRQQDENNTPVHSGKRVRVSSGTIAKSFRLLTALLVVTVLIGVIAIGGVWFLLQGKAKDGSLLHGQIEAGLEKLVGSDFDVTIGQSDLQLGFANFSALRSEQVLITRKSDGATFAQVQQLDIGLKLFAALTGEASVGDITIKNATINADVITSGRPFFLPPHLDQAFGQLGQEIKRLNSSIKQSGFESLTIENARILGQVLGRKQTDEIKVRSLTLAADSENGEAGEFNISSHIETLKSDIKLQSNYVVSDENGSQLNFDAVGVSLQEWLQPPESTSGIIGSDSVVRAIGSIPFGPNFEPADPTVQITSESGLLRIGKNAVSNVDGFNLNFRVILDRNQIELDPSTVQVGRLDASLIGGIKPVKDLEGYGGDFRYDIIMSKGIYDPLNDGEAAVPAGFKAVGEYSSLDKIISIKDIFLTTADGYVQGTADVGLSGETPWIKGEGWTSGISVDAVKQFWPYFIAGGARDWVQRNVLGGRLKSGKVIADIPAGYLFKLDQGAKLKPEYLKGSIELENFAMLPLGELPAIRDGIGEAAISGMEITAALESGEIRDGIAGKVKLSSATFRMEDFGAEIKKGETALVLDGSVPAIAGILDSRPLRVLERIKARPENLKGVGHANIVAEFPISKKAKYSDVKWSVLLDVENGSSLEKLAKRSISDANVLIDANPDAARVTGTAVIDGVKANISLVEPIGKSGKVKRLRAITTRLDDKSRKKLGFDLDPVIVGPVNLKIIQSGKTEKHELDLKDAEISLPWIGWKKGKGVPANSSFTVNLENGVYRLDDFVMQGPGFLGKGKLHFNKSGLLFADLGKLTLNEVDDLGLVIKQQKGAYDIKVQGKSFDARSLLNYLIHKGGFKDAQGDRSVNLTAQIDHISGFEGRLINNVAIKYQTQKGSLHRLDATGVGNNGAVFKVNARRNNATTTFEIAANDAGTGLAFSNIYTKMRGGSLVAKLQRKDAGPYVGPVILKQFDVVNEPKLSRLASNVNEYVEESGGRVKRLPIDKNKSVRFVSAKARIEKGEGYLNAFSGRINSQSTGMTFEGRVFDKKDRINLTGTFIPALQLNKAISAIPIFGKLLAGGEAGAMIGITYKLTGPRSSPELIVNPASAIAPGIFKRAFEFEK